MKEGIKPTRTVQELRAFLEGKDGELTIWGTTSDNGTGLILVGGDTFKNY